MAKSERMIFSYKEVIQVAIIFKKPPRKSLIEYTPPDAPENLMRELLPMCYYLIDKYRTVGKIPPIEEAKMYSAYFCIDRETFGGDITTWDPKELAKGAGVSPEFAQFRINLDLQNPPRRSYHE